MRPEVEVVAKESKKVSSSNKFIFKLYDAFGGVCYNGNDYQKALQKAKLLPYMAYIKAFDENNNCLAVVWAAPETGVIATNISSLMPN